MRDPFDVIASGLERLKHAPAPAAPRDCSCGGRQPAPGDSLPADGPLSLLARQRGVARRLVAGAKARHQGRLRRRLGARAGSGAAGSMAPESLTAPEPTTEPVMQVKTCAIARKDLQLWNMGGILDVDSTTGFTDNCDTCKNNDVECGKDEVPLKDGNCMCLWRVIGAPVITAPLFCDACVEDCIGDFRNFDVGKFLNPVQTGGMCIFKSEKVAMAFDVEDTGPPEGGCPCEQEEWVPPDERPPPIPPGVEPSPFDPASPMLR